MTSAMMLSVALALLAALPASAAQPEPLFVHRTQPSAQMNAAIPTADGPVVERRVVGLRVDLLFDVQGGAAATAILNTGRQTWTARFERLDVDAAGFRSWVGAIDGIADSHVVFTERHGVVSGLINAVGITYQLRTHRPGTYLLEAVDTARLGDEPEPLHTFDTAPDTASPSVSDEGQLIDVLMLYTPAARAQVGGAAQIQALASQVISDTNTAFTRSGILPRVRLVGVMELPLVESPQMSADLPALRASPTARGWRDQSRADLVQLLVSSPDQSSCGIGYLLGSLSNTNFDAYSIADVVCAAQYTPTHEIGHNLGSHHAPEDGASGALLPYSYGFKDPARAFRTVMAYSCASVSCPRVPQISNPLVTYSDGPTGTAAQDNARSMSQAAFTAANFRQSTPTALSPPSAPTGLRSQMTGNQVTVVWDAVTADGATSAATGYVLQVGTTPGGTNLFNGSVGGATTASGAVGDGTYFWRVVAFNSAGSSSPSIEAQFTVGVPCVPPSSPRQFTFSVSGLTVTLQWLPPESGTTPATYIVEAGSASGLADLFNGASGPASTVVTTAPPGVYWVRIRARNACGTSGVSNEQVIVVP